MLQGFLVSFCIFLLELCFKKKALISKGLMITHSQLSMVLLNKQKQREKQTGYFPSPPVLIFYSFKFGQSKFVQIVSRFFLLYFTYRGHTLLKFLHWKRFTELMYTNLYIVIVSTEKTNCNSRIIIAFPK